MCYMGKLITVCWFGFSHNFRANRNMSLGSFIREHPFTMWALNIWIVRASCNQITMVIISFFIIIRINPLISTLIPLVNFGTFFSRIKMYTLFPLHHSTYLILLSHIRLLPLHSVSGKLFRLIDRSMLLVVTEGWLFAKLTCRLLSHHGSLVWTQFLIKASTTIDLLGSRSGRGTAIGSPLWISQLRRGFRFVDDVFTFRDMTFSGNYK
jgi:hypothetical protein